MRRILAIFTPLAGICLFTWSQTFFSAAAVVAVPACSVADASPIAPVTGIVVLADRLTAGHGCGTGPGQIYKYVTIVSIPAGAGAQLSGEVLAASVTDCFTNATFTNLCTYGQNSSTSVTPYDVAVYAFTAAQWNPTSESDSGVTGNDASALGDSSSDASGPNDAAVTDAAAPGDASPTDGGAPDDASPSDASGAADNALPPTSVAVGGAEIAAEVDTVNKATTAANSPANSTQNSCIAYGTSAALLVLNAELAGSAGWSASCAASISSQQANVPVLASCPPLVPNPLVPAASP